MKIIDIFAHEHLKLLVGNYRLYGKEGFKMRDLRGRVSTINFFFTLLAAALCFSFYADLSSAATIELRQTGQTTTYGTGDDASKLRGAEWPNPRLIDNADSTVTDKLTGLIWTQNANTPTVGTCTGGTKSWQGALAYVFCLNSANGGAGAYGHNDWRLPTVNELQSLINLELSNSAAWLNTENFMNVQASNYWTSTTVVNFTSRAWNVNMGSGLVSTAHPKETSPRYVWPVRAGQAGTADPLYPANVWKTGQTTTYNPGDDGDLLRGVSWPDPRFTDNSDGTVTDNLTGLVWLKDANCTDTVGGIRKDNYDGVLQWDKALIWSNSLASGNCSLTDGSAPGDWRLPNREELYSLTDFSRNTPMLPEGHPFIFLITSTASYWTSTTYMLNTTNAWLINMTVGSTVNNVKTDDNNYMYGYYVLPVRGGGLYGNSGISVSPVSHDFGVVTPGFSSLPQTFTVTNTGTNNLYITTITMGGTNPGEFDIQNNDCSDTMVAPSGACTLEVVFSPATAGTKTANLSIPSNVPSSPELVNLIGGELKHTITTVVSAGSGTISCLPNPVDDGMTSSCAVAPGTGYHVDIVSGCGGTWTGSPYITGPITADCTVTAAFAVNTYTISYSFTGNGTMSCTPTIVSEGGSFECTLVPGNGAYLGSLLDNSVEVKSSVINNVYTVSNVTANHTLHAAFENYTVLRISGGSSQTWYTVIQSAYNAASSDDEIRTQASDYSENLDFNRIVTITLKGGYASDFNSVAGYTVLNGRLTVSSGAVIVENLIIQ